MAEIESGNYCAFCEKTTLHMFSGSMGKGMCLVCGHKVMKRNGVLVSEDW